MPSGKNKPYMKPAFNAGNGLELQQGWSEQMTSSKERRKVVFNRKKKKK